MTRHYNRANVAQYNARIAGKAAGKKNIPGHKRLTPEKYAESGTEHGQQVALFMWAAANLERYPELELMHAIPNGGLRDPITAGRLKAEGVKAGVPDIFVPHPMGKWHGLYVEMKRPGKAGKERKRHGLVSAAQEEIRGKLIAKGYGVGVAFSYVEARDLIINYLDPANHV